MDEYVSRQDVITTIRENGVYGSGYSNEEREGNVVDMIESVPAADVRPMVKAKWEWNDNNGYYYCGNCGAVSPREDQHGEYIDCPNFCHNCGADMREES